MQFKHGLSGLIPKKIQAAMPQNNVDHIPNIIIHTNLYTGSYRLFTKIYPQMGIETRSINMNDLDALKAAVDENTKLIFFETPANPNIDVLDIQAISEIAHSVGAKCIVDNTFALPALQQPLKFGADLVVESLTKYINGHGDRLEAPLSVRKNNFPIFAIFGWKPKALC